MQTPRRPIACRAEQSGADAEPAAAATTEQVPAAAPAAEQQQPAAAPAPSAPLLEKGQGTAIVTGAISVIFGIAYLALVYVMDMRGGEMLPPPPEAYLP